VANGRTVYVDYLQNIEARRSLGGTSSDEFAGVSTPSPWDELDEEIAPRLHARDGRAYPAATLGADPHRPTADLREALERLARRR